MKKFFNKNNWLEQKYFQKLFLLSGALSMMLLVCFPTTASAFTLNVAEYDATPNPVPYGQTVTVVWNVPVATYCSFSPAPYTPGLSGGYAADHGILTATITQQVVLTMYCVNDGSANQGYTNPQQINLVISSLPPACSNGLDYGTYGPSCTCPGGQVQSGASCIVPSCANGLNYGTYGPSCTCPGGQVQSGASCIVPSCANGLNYGTYGPSCTCPGGQHQSGSVCVANPVDNCPTVSTASGAGLLVGPGVHNIVGAGQDFCVNNQSSNTYFVQTSGATAAGAIGTFIAATQGYLSGSVSYFARTAGF